MSNSQQLPAVAADNRRNRLIPRMAIFLVFLPPLLFNVATMHSSLSKSTARSPSDDEAAYLDYPALEYQQSRRKHQASSSYTSNPHHNPSTATTTKILSTAGKKYNIGPPSENVNASVDKFKVNDDNEVFLAQIFATLDRKNKIWNDKSTQVLKKISLPKWTGKAEAVDGNDLLGDIWLPPRLPIADDVRTLKYGVLFCGVGSITYAENQMVPMIRHLRDNLGIPDAHERSSLRKKGIYSGESNMGFALVTKKEFVDGPLKDLTAFFDAVYLVEDLPPYPHDWQKQTTSHKAAKVHAMSSAPFDTTLMLDFDSFPCQKRFAEPLLEAFNEGNADIGFTNVIDKMRYLTDSRHFLAEHNSAVVVLNMTSIRTRVLLALYIQAFHCASEEGGGKMQRDQPALMVAMQAMVEGFHPHGELLPQVPNDSVREVIEHYNLDFIHHVDFNSSLVCRPKTGNSVCSMDSSCLIAHKARTVFDAKAAELLKKQEKADIESNMTPIKIFGIGFKKTGTTSLDSMYSHLIDVFGGSRPRPHERAEATSDMIKGDETSTLALAEKYHYFQDSPWCHEPNKLYQRFARLYPTSKFVLTTRNADEWYNSVVRWVKCVPGKEGQCGNKKMERYRAIFGANSTSQEDFISAFELHNSDARQFFNEELNQPERLLDIDLTNKDYGNRVGWKLFCDFVGLSKEQCPTGDIPYENKT